MDENLIINRVSQILFNRYHLESAARYTNPVTVTELSTDYLTTTLQLNGEKLILKVDTSGYLKERGISILQTPFSFAVGKRRRFGDVYLNDKLRMICAYRLIGVIQRAKAALNELVFSDKYNELKTLISSARKEPERILLFGYTTTYYES